MTEKDDGIYDAMNKAVSFAKGSWINFMNAGDTFSDKSTISNFINDLIPDTDLYFGDIKYFNSADSEEYEYRKAMGINNIWRIIPCCHQALFSKVELLREFPFNLEYKIAADYEFLIRCYLNGSTFQYKNEAICDFLGGGLHKTQFIKTRIESMMILSKYIKDGEDILNSNYFKSLSNPNSQNNNLLFSININKLYKQIIQVGENYQKIAIYGNGLIANHILSILKDKVTLLIDKNTTLQNYNSTPPTISMDKLSNYTYDILIISVLGRESEIKLLLKKYKIDKSRIIEITI